MSAAPLKAAMLESASFWELLSQLAEAAYSASSCVEERRGGRGRKGRAEVEREALEGKLGREGRGTRLKRGR